MKQRPITIYRAAAIRDASGADSRPGAVVVNRGRVVAAGETETLLRKWQRHGRVVDRPTDLILPAMVNAHAHLDLTGLGPMPMAGGFTDWLWRVTADRPRTVDAIGQAVARGAALSRASGVGFVADVANSTAAIGARRRGPLPGVSYLECFGLGARQAPHIAQLQQQLGEMVFETPADGHYRGVVLGISPHAPYTAGLDLYAAATKLSQGHAYRLCSHAAETPEEIEFVRDGTGPCRNHLQQLGQWDDTHAAAGTHPVDYLKPYLRQGRWLLAHCNYLGDEHIEILHRTHTSVVYCPRASDYFGHPRHGGHRYRELIEAGVNVCLGTDSILCQPHDEPQPMGILPQMRHLYRRDSADPGMLLKMATTCGMLAMEFSATDATLQKGAPAFLCGVRIDPDDPTDPLIQALANDEPVKLILHSDSPKGTPDG